MQWYEMVGDETTQVFLKKKHFSLFLSFSSSFFFLILFPFSASLIFSLFPFPYFLSLLFHCNHLICFTSFSLFYSFPFFLSRSPSSFLAETLILSSCLFSIHLFIFSPYSISSLNISSFTHPFVFFLFLFFYSFCSPPPATSPTPPLSYFHFFILISPNCVCMCAHVSLSLSFPSLLFLSFLPSFFLLTSKLLHLHSHQISNFDYLNPTQISLVNFSSKKKKTNFLSHHIY
ncbi:unnamed protein product [Acanthosepion pharaonis]|uniref:Uncharacterized protein n=1 Tax=Acanthosepion pharaonis TaxID=158019 RepID=A0A812BMT9_ACAPH|nr:unnamed protein product [Sepia pharaonis]